MKQLSELHRMYGLAMKDIIVRLWPAEPIPSSYFGLVRRLADALTRVEAVKRSTCIEGACMAFAHVKMHWAKMSWQPKACPKARTTASQSGSLTMSWRVPE